MHGLLRTDGGCRPTNPGHAGYGAVLYTADGERWQASNYLTGKKSNNHAEYAGLLVGIKMAVECRVTELEIIVDSQLLMHQVRGEWKCKESDLRLFHKEIVNLLRMHFESDEEKSWKISWERRENNKEADELCTQAIHYLRNLNPWIPSSVKEKRGPGYIFSPPVRST